MKRIKSTDKTILLLIFIITAFYARSQTKENPYYFKNGKVAFKEIENSNGEIIERIIYRSNGEIKWIVPLENDNINGTLKKYNRKGKLTSEGEYKSGVLDGKQIDYFKHSTHVTEFENGKRNNIFHVIEYYKNGNLKSEYNNKFFEGYGPFILYNKNGTTRIEGNYNGIKRIGEWKFYNKDGKLKKTKEYQNKFIFSFRQCVI